MRDSGTVPPERWHYPVSATGYDVYAPNWPALYSEVEKHCLANNVSPPGLQEIIDWCCQNLHIPCYESATKTPLVNAFVQGLPVVLPGCCGTKPK